MWGVIDKHKASLKRRFGNISEDINKSGADLSTINSELYISEEANEEVNKEHDIWQIELASRDQTPVQRLINVNDIFRPSLGQNTEFRTVMTKGVAGIGKTVSVQRFILDWIGGIANQDVLFIFPLSFRELNLVKEDQYSLQSLLCDFYPELKELNTGEEFKNCRVVFIFDGLDESRLSLNFQQNKEISDEKQGSSVSVLITSLIKGALLPSALIWITSRPAAAGQIPSQYLDQVTEVRGFNDSQKEEYLKKRISDGSQVNKIISHIKASRSLHTMCHIPVFCWITATVLQQMVRQDNSQEIPKTLTEMFIHFLHILTARKNQTNKEQLLESQREIILKLAKLAFKNVENGNVMFYEDDLKECNIDLKEESIDSSICTDIFKEEYVLHQRKVYCFVHLSIQEFLAALHVFVCYSSQMKTMGSFFCLTEALEHVVKKVYESKNGHLDLFLCFLMGISLESNQKLLKGLVKHINSNSDHIRKTCEYIKKLNREEDITPERYISLLQCLSEVHDHSIYEEIQEYLKSPKGFKDRLTPAHCSALAHILLKSEDLLDELDPKKYNTSDEGRRRLIPAMQCFRKAKLDRCKLNKMSCATVKRCLQSRNSLIHLDLSCNPLGDSGVQILTAGLTSPHSKLQNLRLSDCKLGDLSCKNLATVLQSPNSLISLDLSHNDIGDSGVELLSKGLANIECKLQISRLSGCLISEKGCGFLASALTSNPSYLKELDLSYNYPGESGLKLLCARLENCHCKLDILKTDHCSNIRFRPGVQKYPCEITLDPNTAHKNLFLSDKKLTSVGEAQPYPDHPARFERWYQVLCKEGLSGRCYWEAEWSVGPAHIAVAYESIMRKGCSEDSRFGYNSKSWTLYCSPDSYAAWHNKARTVIPAPSSDSSRIGVYLDWPAGTLSFYSVSSDTLTHLHTFHSTFTEPLYPGFWVWNHDSSVSLCQIT